MTAKLMERLYIYIYIDGDGGDDDGGGGGENVATRNYFLRFCCFEKSLFLLMFDDF